MYNNLLYLSEKGEKFYWTVQEQSTVQFVNIGATDFRNYKGKMQSASLRERIYPLNPLLPNCLKLLSNAIILFLSL